MSLPSKMDYLKAKLQKQGADDLCKELDSCRNTDASNSTSVFNNVIEKANNRGLDTYIDESQVYKGIPQR